MGRARQHPSASHESLDLDARSLTAYAAQREGASTRPRSSASIIRAKCYTIAQTSETLPFTATRQN